MLGCLSGKMAAKLPVTMKIEAGSRCRRAFSINDRFEGSARTRIRRGGPPIWLGSEACYQQKVLNIGPPFSPRMREEGTWHFW